MIDISLEADIFVQDPLQKFLQEIDVLFNTKLTSVLTDIFFGSEYEQFLWSMTDNTADVENYTRRLIQDNAPSARNYQWDVGCTFIYDHTGAEFYYVIFGVIDPSTSKFIKKNYIMHNYDESPEKQIINMIHK